MKAQNEKTMNLVHAARDRISRLYFTVVKLPLMLLAIVAGFIFEFLLELPFIFLIIMGYRSKIRNKP
jgi:hypothetical protein